MKLVALIIAVLVLLLIGVSLWWRCAARRRSLPCPAWLAWLLENPVTDRLRSRHPRLEILAVKPGMRVIDVGCGPGRLTIPVARQVGPEGEVVALDMQPEMLGKLEKRIAASGLNNIRAVLGGIGQTEIDRDAFDLALLVTVLGEIPDREAALRGIYGSLKPGGILSVTEIFPDPHYQTRATVRTLAEDAGFRVEREYGNWWSFTMNFVKPISIPE